MEQPNLIAMAIPLFLLGIVIELAVAKVKKRPVYRLQVAMSDMGCGIAQQLVSLFLGTGLLLGGYAWLYEYRFVTLPTAWLPWVLAVLGVEFAYYWWHRLSHEVNLLWAAHVVHHHSEDYNLAVALRQSVTTWATTIPFYYPLALLGVPPLPFGVVLGLSTLYQFWIHTELIPPLGFLEKIFNTPALHRVHHAINPGYLDKNHAATFSFFDRMFGTWQPETEPCVYGTTAPLQSFNPVYAQVERYVELFRLAARAPTLKDRFKVFFASPAWRPEWMGSYTPRDFSTKYNPNGSIALKVYAFVNWAVLLVGVFVFLLWSSRAPVAVQAAGAILIVWTTLTLPTLLEGRSWARWLEAGRLLALPVLAVLLVQAVR